VKHGMVHSGAYTRQLTRIQASSDATPDFTHGVPDT